MAGHSWALLPSVLIVEILSYLSLQDRLNASRVCKRWRSYLFQPQLWPRISLTLHRNRKSRNNFLTDVCGRFVKECAIKFDPHDVSEVRDCLGVLSKLRMNRSLQVLQIEPSSNHFAWTETLTSARFIQVIEEIIQGSRKLKHLSLGCNEELLAFSSSMVDSLADRHSKSLESLHIASVKEDSEAYGIVDLNIDQFSKFSCLKHLSIDYDFVDMMLLATLSNQTQHKLETLVIHVHGVDEAHEIIPDVYWRQFASRHTNIEVTLNLVHSFNGVSHLLNILKPSLPLTHFRQFFCSRLNVAAIGQMANHYDGSLKSVVIIDGLEQGEPMPYLGELDTEDPFVMLAWKCKRLNSFTMIGYEMDAEDIVAIARLRSDSLHTLNIPACCITDGIDTPNRDAEIAEMVSLSLFRAWRPLYDEELPYAVFDECADAEGAYNHLLLEDQRYVPQKKTA